MCYVWLGKGGLQGQPSWLLPREEPIFLLIEKDSVGSALGEAESLPCSENKSHTTNKIWEWLETRWS
jgi:hypothetical protein